MNNPMEITQQLIIKYEISKFEPDKPYCLWIVGNGRVDNLIFSHSFSSW